METAPPSSLPVGRIVGRVLLSVSSIAILLILVLDSALVAWTLHPAHWLRTTALLLVGGCITYLLVTAELRVPLLADGGQWMLPPPTLVSSHQAYAYAPIPSCDPAREFA